MIRYQITDGNFTRDPAAWMRKLRPDVDFIQIRENDLPARSLAELVRRAIAATGVRVFVNDRIDVAIAAGAAGVHLRGGSIPPSRVKALAPLLVSVAVHCEADIKRNVDADLLIVAPVFPPRSKPDPRAPLGLDELHRLTSLSPVPVLALGGITEENGPACVRAGAAGIAGITLFSRQA